jgi:hypothetical protein
LKLPHLALEVDQHLIGFLDFSFSIYLVDIFG